MVRCVLLEVAADPGRLYDGDDPGYELWLLTVCDRVESAHREAEARAKARKGK